MADTFSISQSGLDQISQLALQFMQEQWEWGQQQFADNAELTDQVVGDLMNLYGSLSGIGGDLMGMYDRYFTAEYQNLVADANSYSSQARIQQAMGAAESGVAQNFNSQRNAALADLQAFGIDPSSGRYAQLDAAERTQEAAAQAGAGFQAEQATEATGRALRSEALQLGSVMPSQATAAYNAAQGAATAGMNAKLASAQEGINLRNSGVPWGQVGQEIKHSQSGPSGGGQVRQQSKSSSGNNSGGPRGPGGPNPWDASETASQADPNWAGSGGDGGGGGRGGYGGPGGQGNPNAKLLSGGGQGGGDGLGGNSETAGGSNDYSTNDAEWGPSDLGDNTSTAGGANDASTSDTDYGGSDFGENTSTAGGANDESTADFGSSGGDDFGSSSGGGGGDDFSQEDQPTYDDSGYAAGGKVKSHEGAIPFSRSPSHGRETDDVPARLNQTGEHIRLNAGEFVIPRHAVAWKGEKYFQDLIRRSREERGAAGAKPTMKPALPSQRSGAQHVR